MTSRITLLEERMYGQQARVEITLLEERMYGRQSRVEIKHYITGGENVWAAVTGRNHYWRPHSTIALYPGPAQVSVILQVTKQSGAWEKDLFYTLWFIKSLLMQLSHNLYKCLW